MNETAGALLGATIGISAGGVGAYFAARFAARRAAARFTRTLAALAPVCPPCVGCGEPTGSPRLDQCDRCHSRALVAAFDQKVATLRLGAAERWDEESST